MGLAAVAVLSLLGLRLLVAEPFRIPSDSMLPTLRAGDHVIVDHLAYRGSAPRRGDLAVFHEPGTGRILLKRVVAVGGETIGLDDGALVVAGRRVHEPYANPSAIDSVYFGPITVPRGSFFALGDNRADSYDSRQFGPVPDRRLIGRVVVRVWPPTRWGAPD